MRLKGLIVFVGLTAVIGCTPVTEEAPDPVASAPAAPPAVEPSTTQTAEASVPTAQTRVSPAELDTNQQGIDVITQSEGLRLEAYTLNGQTLIGYGHAATAKPGMRITEAKAEELLRRDLQTCETAIEDTVTVALTENEFSGLVPLCYNIGTGNFAKSTVVRKLNEGAYEQAADAILLWNKAGGTVNEHLVKRREQERALFLK